jgi:glutaredoxin
MRKTRRCSRALFSVQFLLCLFLILPASAAVSSPRVTVFGASWCGPCRIVKDFLTKNAVPFEWLDIDVDANRERFETENDGNGGIPLILVGNERIRGSNLRRLAAALGKGDTSAAASARPGEELYGDHGASWWQAQFVSLKARLKTHKERIAVMRRTAQSTDELDAVRRMERAQQPIEQAINQLEIDASEAALPRKYRGD